jgi:hypothetical protein
MSRLANALLKPQNAVLRLWKALGTASFQSKLDYDLFERPHYAYCLASAARLAAALGVPRIAAIEFGVAGGCGLLTLESLCPPVERTYGVEIEIWGFDTGEGLPEPLDYRDLPYIWQKGFYRMNPEALRDQLSRSRLVLGDVKDTVAAFVQTHGPAPIGAVFLDLDFWSSTRAALSLFTGPAETMLPRIYCYCDDVVSAEGGGVLCEDVGQLRAIRDYNTQSEMRKLRPIAGLPHTRRVSATWNTQVYVHHIFDHPAYSAYIHDDVDRQLPIN